MMMNELRSIIFVLTLMFVSCTSRTSRVEMERVLSYAQQQNLEYDSITNVDSIAMAVTYFDKHGSPNDQMRAYYLLGCAYRDMGEAPAALQYYQAAVEHADTTDSDCDFRWLMRIYGQMADLFQAQNLPTDELDASRLCRMYAKRLNDTLSYVRTIELDVGAYFLMYDTLSMIKVLKQAQNLYNQYGYYQEAASIYPSIIDIYINKDSLGKAKELMQVFEYDSGLFDSVGNISAGRESYYYLKGLYYDKLSILDSAEYYYRRSLDYGFYTDAYRGLLSVYRGQDKDSIYKYAHLFESAVDHEKDALRTQTIHQMTSLYNYHRFMKKADTESRKAEQFKYYLRLALFLVIICLLVITVIIFILTQKRKQQELENERLRKVCTEAVSKKNMLVKEVDILKKCQVQLRTSEKEARDMLGIIESNYDQLMKAKESEITELNNELREYASRLLKTTKMAGDNAKFTLLTNDFHQKALRKRKTSLPKRVEWNQLLDMFAKTYPSAYISIGRDQLLSVQELKVCILLLLKFSNNEVMSLLDISPQRMTNIKTRINEKLFGEASATNLAHNLRKFPIES